MYFARRTGHSRCHYHTITRFLIDLALTLKIIFSVMSTDTTIFVTSFIQISLYYSTKYRDITSSEISVKGRNEMKMKSAMI